MKEITQSDLLLRKLEAGIIDLVTLIKEHQREKELSFDEKIDKQIQESNNLIMNGVRFRLAIKVNKLRQQESYLRDTLESKLDKLELKYTRVKYDCFDRYMDRYKERMERKELLDNFVHFRVNSLLNIRL